MDQHRRKCQRAVTEMRLRRTGGWGIKTVKTTFEALPISGSGPSLGCRNDSVRNKSCTSSHEVVGGVSTWRRGVPRGVVQRRRIGGGNAKVAGFGGFPSASSFMQMFDSSGTRGRRRGRVWGSRWGRIRGRGIGKN